MMSYCSLATWMHLTQLETSESNSFVMLLTFSIQWLQAALVLRSVVKLEAQAWYPV